MTSYLNHPVLLEMLSSRCCPEADAGRSFHLYMTLCEQYRVPKVEWHCDQDLGIIYMVTGEVEAVIPPPEHEADSRRKHAHSPTLSATSGDGVKQEKTASPADTKLFVDAHIEEIVAKDDIILLPTPHVSAPSDSSSEHVTEIATKPSLGDSQDRLDTETPTVFISFSFEAIIKHSFLVAIDNLCKKYPGARLCVVPTSHWSVLGNYIVNCDVQAEVYHSSRPGALRSNKTEDAIPRGATVTGAETTDAEQEPLGGPSSLHPGCFPEAYIATAQRPLVDEDSAAVRPVCFPEAYIINARQQQEQLQQADKGDANIPGPACYPEAYIINAQTQYQSAVEGGSTDRSDSHAEVQHQVGTATDPEHDKAASAQVESGRSISAQPGLDLVDWAGSRTPTESWD